MQLSSTRQGSVVSVEPFTIHDQPNVSVTFRLDGAQGVQEARLAVEAVHGELRPGDRIEVKLVLDEAFEIRRL